jgi:hypothetical protein
MLPYIPVDFWHFICRHFRNPVETQPTSASLRNASRRSHRPRPNKNGDFMRDFIWWTWTSKWTWMDSHSSHQSEKWWFHGFSWCWWISCGFHQDLMGRYSGTWWYIYIIYIYVHMIHAYIYIWNLISYIYNICIIQCIYIYIYIL